MKKQPLYSSRKPGRRERRAETAPPPEPTLLQIARSYWNRIYTRHQKPVLVATFVLAALAMMVAYDAFRPQQRVFTQSDIDSAVKYTLQHQPRAPSKSSVAYALVRPSVVRVNGYNNLTPKEQAKRDAEKAKRKEEAKKEAAKQQDAKADAGKAAPKAPNGAEEDEDEPDSVGTGVVIDEEGRILTNLHVAASADHLKVIFYDGSVSEADIVGTQPEDDLAVLKARTLPDDLKPATLASTKNLRPGDEVTAIGYPFGIGPSASSGVVSGLKRQFTAESGRTLTNLIQFDAAANPGNSGGPLIDDQGEVVGIVTGILNPTEQRVFVGIGFAVPIENAAAAAGMSPF